MEGRQLRDRDAILIDLVGVAGLMAFVAGLVLLQNSDKLGFDPNAALEGVLGQLSITLPDAVLLLGATALDLVAGLVLVRLLRRRPFDSLAEAAIAGMAGAVVKDTFLLGTLAAFGAFRAPVLIAIDVAVIAAALWLAPAAALARPVFDVRWRDVGLTSIGSWTIAVLVAVVWAGPVVLQLASPVVPFVDVLPNYVAPAEHLRTFGWFTPLTATQSPIYGPSRTVFGFDGVLGSLATMTNLGGGLVVAAFILPLTILVAAAAHRLATAVLRGTSISVGPWALLTFALTQPFARLSDARGTVVVVPLAALGLAVAAEALRSGRVADDEEPDTGQAWRFGRGPIIGLSLGAAALVHPVIGFFGIVTVAIAALVRPRELAADTFVAGVTAALLAGPQLATMLGISLPTLALGGAVAAAVVAGVLLGRLVEGNRQAANVLVRIAQLGRLVVPLILVGAFLIALAIGPLELDKAPRAIGDGVKLVLESSGLLLVVIVIAVALGSSAARSAIVIAGLAVGVGALLLTGVLPDDLGVLGDALHFELPKTVHYWLSMVAAAGAAAGLAYAWQSGRIPLALRGALAAAFVVVAALPLRPEPIDAYHLGEHRYAETFAISLKFAGSGFWVGYPDSRTVVDAPRQELLDAVRAEITAGRLQHDTRVLHLASTFQQWNATPLGVFVGVDETSITLDPEHSQHTAGGRLFGFEDLAAFLASGDFGYVLLEPGGLPDGLAEQVQAAGYTSIFANGQGQLFRKGT